MKPQGSSINKPGSKYSPAPVIYNWALFKMDATGLNACPSVEDFVMRSGLGHCRPHKLAPHWNNLSCTADLDHGRSQGSAHHWKTLPCAADFDHKRPQQSAPGLKTLSYAADFGHKGPQGSAQFWSTLSCSADFDHEVSNNANKPQ